MAKIGEGGAMDSNDSDMPPIQNTQPNSNKSSKSTTWISMTLAPNKVLIAPDPNHTVGAGHGVELVDANKDQFNLCVTGTVIQVCDKLEYHGREIRRLQKIGDPEGIIGTLTVSSMPWETNIEVRPGDKVIFPFIHRLGDKSFDEEQLDGNLLIGYDSLIGVIDPDFVQPINGNIFVTKVEKEDMFEGLQPGLEKYLFRVYSVGLPVANYLDYGNPDIMNVVGITKGALVLADSRFAISVETPQQMRIFDAPVYYLQRRHVFAKLKNTYV